MKMCWDIANKKESLWIKWIHSRYIKQGDFWDTNSKPGNCYYWKKILRNRRWFEDMPRDKNYTVEDGYNWLIGERQKPEWIKLVWNRYILPKHQYIMWLIVKGRIQTKERLSKFFPVDTTCLLCKAAVEDINHLFCTCDFTKLVRAEIIKRFGVCYWGETVGDTGRNILQTPNGKKRNTQAALFAAVSYNIWRTRNHYLHRNEEPMVSQCAQKAIYQIEIYMKGKGVCV
ncbi:unnamed protein product [Cuscuta campestris]|uniref:Reverse transcriptase zinc-binding domain-containing protein n=1 Tax=Cuscuta campestris TaxID=132261 RepID=A0A484LRY5_9ASTE|nr:unnamed protein product [Cuscuta campestris]